MTREIPTPLRAAAGLAAIAVDEARRLPNRLATLPIVAVGAAMQASMKIQQRYAGLVARGDEVLDGRRAGEQPPWARFDEDDPAATRLADAQSWMRAEEEIPDLAEDASDYDDLVPGSVNGHSPAEPHTAGSPASPARPMTENADDPSLPLPAYDRLSLPQLRARLRDLAAADLTVLIDHERAHAARPPYLTMLENRLATVTRD